MGWFRSRHDLDDERVLIGVTAGVLWLVGSVAAGIGQLLPGSPTKHVGLFAVLVALVFAYGLASVAGWIDWSKVSVRRHALTSAALMPLLAVALWLTGGEDSFLKPILILALLQVAYFFRPRVSALLVFELILIASSPVLYEKHINASSPALFVSFSVAAVVLSVILRLLKNRLVAAEALQREMALRDPLTGLVNRRGFDEALLSAVAARGVVEEGRRDRDSDEGFALIVFDLDHFKIVNDTSGHPAGDRLLRGVAAATAAIVRPTDTLARIGGDEFALIAPGAGIAGASRLASELLGAVREAGAQATAAWAVHPKDGEDGETLLRIADRRLYEGKAHARGQVVGVSATL